MKRRHLRFLLALFLLAILCQGCQFLQNEFFFYDKASPPAPVEEQMEEDVQVEGAASRTDDSAW